MTIYLVLSGPDELGRHTFWGFWADYVGPTRDEWGVRGQIFRSDLTIHLAQAKTDGRKVKVLNLAMMGGMTEAEASELCKKTIRAMHPTPASV